MPIIAHEIGHAFGLFHNEVNNTMMGPSDGPMLDYEARWLSKSHYFNDTHIRTDIPEFVDFLGTEAIGRDIIKFKFSAHSDSELFHSKIIRIRGGFVVLGDDELNGKDDIAEINVPRQKIVNGDKLSFRIMDVNGNYIFKDITYESAQPGPKIEGPWSWVLVPGKDLGNIDLLSAASNGEVTELEVSTEGARPGKKVGNSEWTQSILPIRVNNFNLMLDALDISNEDRRNRVIYGSISLNSPMMQEITMFVGADDRSKIWLNGELVYDEFVFGGASDYKRDFPVTLKQGTNVLLVAVDNFFGSYWAGFFGFAEGTEYTLIPPVPYTPLVLSVGASVNINELHAIVGDTFTIYLNTDDVTDLAGSQVDIAFDPNLLEAIEVTEGEFLKVDDADTFFQGGTIDNTIGKIIGIYTAVISEGGVSGTGTLLSVTFRAKAAGETIVSIENFEFGSISGDVIPSDPTKVIITVGKYPAWDVNQDGRGSILDLILVAKDLGSGTTANLKTDVNRDGVINIQDLILVAQHIGETTDNAAASPLAAIDSKVLTPAIIQTWIKRAQAEDDGSLAFRQGIKNLKTLLASVIPKKTTLLANYPNPFNPETWIPYQLAEPAEATLTIYTADGAIVRIFTLGFMPAGIYQRRSRAVYWDGKNAVGETAASGVYFYTLTAGNFTVTRKMLILK